MYSFFLYMYTFVFLQASQSKRTHICSKDTPKPQYIIHIHIFSQYISTNMPFLKLWKTSPVVETLIPPPEYEDEDSFFDLELNKSQTNPKITINNTSNSENSDNKSFESRSLISFLRSPAEIPSFLMFKKKPFSVNSSPANSPITLSRENSYKKKSQNPKETVFKYIKLIRVRLLKSSDEISGECFIENSPDREGMRSPSMRFVRRSKSVTGFLPVARVTEDSILQSDGIEGAILHCKRSYNSSRDMSVLSRSVSESAISVNPSRFSIEEKNRMSP